jgi:sterol 3beta-glucosyltransferase
VIASSNSSSTMASPPFTLESPPAVDGPLIPADKVNEPRTHRDVSNVKRLSTVVEKTVDRLSRSVGGTAPPPTSPTSSQGRRVFGLSRRNKQLSIGGCQYNLSYSLLMIFRLASTSESTLSKSLSTNVLSQTEDSPFIRPPSPQTQPSPLRSFDGSVHMSYFFLVVSFTPV